MPLSNEPVKRCAICKQAENADCKHSDVLRQDRLDLEDEERSEDETETYLQQQRPDYDVHSVGLQ